MAAHSISNVPKIHFRCVVTLNFNGNEELASLFSKRSSMSKIYEIDRYNLCLVLSFSKYVIATGWQATLFWLSQIGSINFWIFIDKYGVLILKVFPPVNISIWFRRWMYMQNRLDIFTRWIVGGSFLLFQFMWTNPVHAGLAKSFPGN